MLKTNNLNIGYTQKGNTTNIVSDINITANKGDLIALIGVNGSGKSTLIRSLLKFQNYFSGDIIINDKSLNEYTNNELAENISYVASRLSEQNNITAKDLISLGRLPYTKWFGILSENDKQIINNVINTLGIGKLAKKQFNNLSDGEKQRTLLAMALAQQSDIILLDEPTAFIDYPNKYYLSSLLNQITKTEDKTVVFSSHDLEVVLTYADKILFFSDTKVELLTKDEFLQRDKINRLFEGHQLDKDFRSNLVEQLLINYKSNK